MTESLSGSVELLALCGLLLGPMAVTGILLFLAFQWAKTRLLVVAVAILYVVLTVVAPLMVIRAFFRDELGWMLALFALAKTLEFAVLKPGRAFIDLVIYASPQRPTSA